MRNKRKVPVVQIDESLDKYNNVVLFPEKLAKANEMLRTVGLPKDKKKKASRLKLTFYIFLKFSSN